ncbi:hypothetical protein HMPREF1210_02114 [Paenisporosarcina sp. HGH0030]|uniref:hypothetical protein n=1 Tax=Paenisporosarcina sp. HGH0030 TaxID=1078085 RepID=UPI00034E9105|nr:hypothetical protein [Paenisporosarcina sp. HGH0030]EPD51516.1 hypothetical protein HMPREF1210_02114 [Paenisporosarcina sp. HGH0030]
MQENIKRQLDATIPEQLTLSEEHKRKILMEANQRMSRPNIFNQRLLKPLVGVAIIGLSCFLAFPYIQEWSEEKALHSSEHDLLTEVTIPGVEYDSLINAHYVDETNEMIYTDHEAIYSYSIATKTKEVLIEPKEDARIFNLAVNDEWLVWEEISSLKLYVLNRTSSEIKEFPNMGLSDLQIEGDTLTYMFMGNEDHSYTGYVAMDLPTGETKEIQELVNGSNSKAAINDGLIVIPERQQFGEDGMVTFYVHDLQGSSEVREYTVPYEMAVNVTLTNDKIFAQLQNEDEEVVLGYIDFKDGKFYEVDVPTFEAYAVYGDYVALSVPVKDTNTVKLFQFKKDGVVALSTFEQLNERLVKPRFTKDGTLVVNGEGAQRSMYLHKVNESK